MSMHTSFSGVSLGDGGSSNDAGSHNSENSALDNVGKPSFGFNFESEMGGGNSSNPSEGGDSDEGNPRQQRAGSSTSSGNRASNESGSNGSEEGASPEASVPSPPSDPMQPSPAKDVKAVPSVSVITNANATFGDRSSSEERGGNRSDSSALVNVGKSSFGFNFDSEGGTGNSSNPSEEGDSDEGPNMQQPQQQRKGNPLHVPANVDTSAPMQSKQSRRAPSASVSSNSLSAPSTRSSSQSTKKRSRNDMQEQSSGGYDTDEDEGRGLVSSNLKQLSNEIRSCGMHGADDGKDSKEDKSSSTNDAKREERNAREKARSMRIAKKIEEIREVMHQGGVVLPKGTKSTVLSEASKYMRQLQEKHRRLEGERLSLMQQVRMIGGGLMGDAAAAAIRNVAAQSGAFGKVPQTPAPRRNGSEKPNEVNYKLLFDSCTVGMAIAGIGGSIIDCNELFCEVVSLEKRNVCAMTLFNMTSRQDLHGAFTFMSQILSGPGARRSCVLRAAFADREDLGLLVTLLDSPKDDQKNFCITLLISATSPFDISNAEPATTSKVDEKKEAESLSGSPAFTAG